VLSKFVVVGFLFEKTTEKNFNRVDTLLMGVSISNIQTLKTRIPNETTRA